eukprot:CFRG6022T1
MGQTSSNPRSSKGDRNPDQMAHGGFGGPQADSENSTMRAHNKPIDVPETTESPVFFGSNAMSPLDSGNMSDPKNRKSKSKAIPTVFRWNRPADQVYITGTFNSWKERVPMSSSQEEFTTIIDLPVGTHQYKFIVDDEWCYNPDQPTMPDRSGAINNFVEVADEEDDFDFEGFVSTPAVISSPPGSYAQDIPTLNAQTKPPPVLPAYLMQVLLNCEPVSETDPTLLPIPNHVMLNHLYALSISDGVMVLSGTNRYIQKYVTIVLYRPVD